jgi:molybdopterin-guanine dinucleotide biosynthesis protein A
LKGDLKSVQEQEKFEAIVLAGGRMPSGMPKAMLSRGGHLVVEDIISELNMCPQISRVILVSPLTGKELRLSGPVTYVPEGKTFVESLQNGMQALETSGRFIGVLGDTPFPKACHFSNFIEQARKKSLADIVYGYLSEQTSMTAYPDIPHTCIKLINKEGVLGSYHAAGVAMVNRRCQEKLCVRLELLYRRRKHPLYLGLQFGVMNFSKLVFTQHPYGRFLLKKLSIELCSINDAERAVSQFFGGIHCVGEEVLDAEFGFDVDNEARISDMHRFAPNYK